MRDELNKKKKNILNFLRKKFPKHDIVQYLINTNETFK